MQFHPTAVPASGRDGFLVTEAIRGEGATLHDEVGERFVDELAPRDEVARAIETRLVRAGAPSVGLDMRDIDPGRFPNVVGTLQRAGLDPARSSSGLPGRALPHGRHLHRPRRPLDPGRPVRRGRVACTGLHGANRLASNSLTECFVFGRRAALAGLDDPPARVERRRRSTRWPLRRPSPRPTPATRLWRLAGSCATPTGCVTLPATPIRWRG